ncbi:MAG: hypothetical protein IT342_17315 [Candidatus Melainabacteria bacterium]|nr:hypothetical protein [Candidatus Melainabacteria bacterium]
MTGRWSFCHQSLSIGVALALVLWLAAWGTGAIAKDITDGPDTPVSSDTLSTSPDVINEPHGDVRAAGAPAAADGTAQGNAGAAEIGSQAKTRAPVSHQQEEKDRMFVHATFIAVAIILCVIAFFLFMSLPKQPKKAGRGNQ